MIPVQNCTTEIMTKQGVSEFVDARRTVTWTRTSRDTEDTLTSDLSSSLTSISKATTSAEYGDALEETQKNSRTTENRPTLFYMQVRVESRSTENRQKDEKNRVQDT